MRLARRQDVVLLTIPVLLVPLVASWHVVPSPSSTSAKNSVASQYTRVKNAVLTQTTVDGVSVRVTKAIRNPSRNRITIFLRSSTTASNRTNLGEAIASIGSEEIRIVRIYQKVVPEAGGLAYEIRYYVDYTEGSSFATASTLNLTANLGFADAALSKLTYSGIRMAEVDGPVAMLLTTTADEPDSQTKTHKL